MILGELLRPRPKIENPKPSSLGDFQFPTATESRAVPVAWGTVHSKGPNVTWYGDLIVDPITEEVRTGLFSSKTIIKGYKYYLGVQSAICYGEVDELVEIRHDNKKPTQSTTTQDGGWRVTVSDDDLFGGEEHGQGGVAGAVDVYAGTDDQTANDYLQGVLETQLPAYKRVCYAVFRGYYWGTSNYIKPVSFVIRRTPALIPGMTAGDANISGDANPAVMLYEILTNYHWGLGLPDAQIDLGTFRSVAATLKTDGLGLSMLVDTPTEASGLIDEILRHIDAVLYTDPATGLITLKLARDDYDPSALPVYDVSNVTSCEINRIGWPETRNVVKVKYVDRDADYSERVAQQQNLGNYQARGGELSVEQIEFRGISTAANANRVAARALKALSYPLANVHLVTNRIAWDLRPGSCIVLTWSPLGIANAVFRVTRINYGQLTDGKIELDAVEDIFAITGDAFSPPGASGWTDPNQPVQAAAVQTLIELPYQVVGAEQRFVGALAGRATGQEFQYEIWSDPAGGTDYIHSGDGPAFNPYGYLTAAVEHITDAVTTMTIRAGKDLTTLRNCTSAELQAGKNILLCGNELMAWQTITANGDGTYTLGSVWRGVLDTVPELHNSGSLVWFLSAGVGLTSETAYPEELSLTAKLLPRTFSETLAIGSATQLGITTDSRAWKPLPPGRIRLNGERSWDTITDDAELTWADRNRTTQEAAGLLLSQDDTDISGGPEGNCTAEAVIDGAVVESQTGITGTSWTYTAAAREGDEADGLAPVILRVRGVSGGRSSANNETDPFVMTGMGMTFGVYLGGVDS